MIIKILLVFIVGLLSYISISRLENANEQVDHTQHVIHCATELQKLMIDAETGIRGYGATNDPVFLDPYNAALPHIRIELDSLQVLVRGNATEAKRADSLSDLIDRQLSVFKDNITTRATKGLDYMVKNRIFLNGKQNMDAIRLHITNIVNEETSLLQQKKAKSDRESTFMLVIIIAGSLIFLTITITISVKKKTHDILDYYI